MLTNAQLWAALDELAARAGLSLSGLAEAAGLNNTTFNKSKRITAKDRERWPSTESVAKALAATNTSIETFVQFIPNADRTLTRKAFPLIGLAQAADRDSFDDAGAPVGKAWSETAFPVVNDMNACAVKVSGNSLEPAYRDGAVLVLSPSASIHRGDRLLVKTKEGKAMVCELRSRTSKLMQLRNVDHAQAERTLPLHDVLWFHRIVWASQ